MMAPTTIAKPLLISDLVAQTGQAPLSHARPVADLANVVVGNESGAGIVPLIDLNKLNGPEQRRKAVVEAIEKEPRNKKAIRRPTSFNVRMEKLDPVEQGSVVFIFDDDDATLIVHGGGPSSGEMVSSPPVVVDMPATSPSLSSTSSWSPASSVPAASNPSGAGGNAATAARARPVGTRRRRSRYPPRPRPPVPSATAAATTDEDVSELDVPIISCTMAILMPLAINDYLKDVYAILMALSFMSTLTSIFTASAPAGSWARRLSPSLARFGLVVAAALFVIFVPGELGLGCAAGVASAAAAVAILAAAWIWSAQPAGRAEAAAEESASLPDDAP